MLGKGSSLSKPPPMNTKWKLRPMAKKKRSKMKFTVEDRLLWERRLRRQLDVEAGEYNVKKRRFWSNTTKKDKAEKESNSVDKRDLIE